MSTNQIPGDPLADKVLIPEDQQELMDKFDTVERELGLDVHEGFNKMATELERKVSGIDSSLKEGMKNSFKLELASLFGGCLARFAESEKMEDGSLKSRQTLDVSITKESLRHN